MRYGAHIFLWIDRWSDDNLPLLDHAASLGLSCLEIAVGDEVAIHPASLRRAAESAGLQLIFSPGGEWPMDCDLSHDDPAARAKGLAWHRQWIDRAADAGAIAWCGALYGHPGRICRRLPPADELPRTAENLHILAEHAAAAGLQVALEPMSHFRTHLVNTIPQALRLIDLAHHPNLFVLLDTYHLITEERDFAAAVRAAGRRLWAVHACENDRGAPGDGLVPWKPLFSALAEIQFAGPILLETYNSSLDAGRFAHSRGMFHNVCPDGDAFLRQGLSFLESCRHAAQSR